MMATLIEHTAIGVDETATSSPFAAQWRRVDMVVGPALVLSGPTTSTPLQARSFAL